MPLMTSAAVKAEMAQRAAILQGREGWPTPEWGKGKDRFAVYSPLLNAGAGRKDFPISGTVNGRPYATCRVATSFSRSVGVNSRRTTTYYHTAAIFPNTGVGLPYFDIISTTGEWERLQNFDKLRMNTGDAQFHQFLSVSANAADQPAVYRFLTPQVKAALYDVLRANRSARIRFGTNAGRMFCWVNGKDARDAAFPPLLVALAQLAQVADAQLAAMRPMPAPPPAASQPPATQPPYNPYQPGWR